MRLLLDQGVPRTSARLLCAAGHDAVHVGEIGHSSTDDSVILKLACHEKRVIVTLDADFHALLSLTHATKPSVVRIRIEGLKADQLSQLLQAVILQTEQALEKGAAITVQERRIRVRLLPLPAPP